MDALFAIFNTAHEHHNGYLLASTIDPLGPVQFPNLIYDFAHDSTPSKIETDIRYRTVYNSALGLSKSDARAWLDLYVAYWKFAQEYSNIFHIAGKAYNGSKSKGGSNEALQTQYTRIYDTWKDFVNVLLRGYTSSAFPVWTLPSLYVAGKYLRTFAIKADEQVAKTSNTGSVTFNASFGDDVAGGMGMNDKLEDAARQINRIFGMCISDRAPIDESRKWAIYYITNLLFKTYFKLNSINLCKNILRSLQATSTDMPSLDKFPKSHIVTFKYYVGVIRFLEEDYINAETHLTQALSLCPQTSPSNRQRILTYLIPCHLLTTHSLPSAALLAPYPALARLFSPLSICIRRGDLAGFDTALAANQDEFVKRRIYLTLERGRDICLRNLFRKVFLAGGFEESKDGGKVRRTRVPVMDFVAGMRLSLKGIGRMHEERRTGVGKEEEEEVNARVEEVGRDEVECLIANMIYKNLMKGYISREHAKVVLSKAGAFPGTGV